MRAAATILALSAPAGAAAQTPAEVDLQISDVVQRRWPAIRRCYDKALARDPRRGGGVALVLDIEPGGKVARVLVARDELDDVATAGCLQEVFAGLTLVGFAEGAQVGVPLRFAPPPRQLAVRWADAPGGDARTLLDGLTVGAARATLRRLTVPAGQELAERHHPASCELLFVLAGEGRLGPHRLVPGTAAYLPARASYTLAAGAATLELVRVTAPPGPERPGRADAPARRSLQVVDAAEAPVLTIAGGDARVRILFDAASTGGGGAALSLIEARPGAQVPLHAHDGAEELIYVIAGDGETTIGDQVLAVEPDRALFLPAGVPHALAVGPAGLRALQVYAPPGPEQRFKQPPAATPPADPTRKR